MGVFDIFRQKAVPVPFGTVSSVESWSPVSAGGQTDILKLAELCKHNAILASAIRHIIENALRVRFSEWNGDKQVVNSPMVDFMAKPHTHLAADQTWSMVLFDYLLFGTSYSRIIKTGNTVNINPIPYQLVKPLWDKGADGRVNFGSVQYEISLGGGKTDIIPADEMWVWTDASYGMEGYQGVPRIAHLVYALQNDDAADRFNGGILQNGGIPAGFIISKTTSRESLEKVREQYRANHTGPGKAGAVGFMAGDVEWLQTGQGPTDMAFEAVKKISREEILALYNIPPLLLGITNDVNYAVAKMQRKLFIEVTIQPLVNSLANAVETMFREQLKYGKTSELYADVDQLPEMQDDLLSKMQAAMYAVQMGFDLADVSEKLNLPFDAPTSAHVAPPKEEETKKIHILTRSASQAYRETMKTLMFDRKVRAESAFENKLEKFFIGQRNALLDYLKALQTEKSIVADYIDELLLYAQQNKAAWDNELKTITGAYLTNVTDDVAKKMLEDMGLVYRESVNQALAYSNHLNLITRVNDTTYKALEEGLKNTLANSQDYQTALNQLPAEIRAIMNDRKGGAAVIARTEGNSFANEVIEDNYKQNGVEKQSWLSSRDAAVRESHAWIDGEVVTVGQPFSNGLRFPGDQSGAAAEVVNCRCGTLPE